MQIVQSDLSRRRSWMNSLLKQRRFRAAASWRCSPTPRGRKWDAWASMNAPLPRRSHVLSWTVGRLEVQMKVSLTFQNISTCLQAIVSTPRPETARSSNPCGLGEALERARERRAPVARATLTTHGLMSARPCGKVSLVGGKHGPRGERRAERCFRIFSIAPRGNQGRDPRPRAPNLNHFLLDMMPKSRTARLTQPRPAWAHCSIVLQRDHDQ